MSFYAEPLLREARERVRSLPSQAITASAASPNFDQLAEAVEKAIRAALVENHGSVPPDSITANWFRSVSPRECGMFFHPL